MDKVIFAHALTELGLFFRTFKPSAEQAKSWFRRLKGFSDASLRLAVFRITEERETPPTYPALRRELLRATEDLRGRVRQQIIIHGGAAPRTPELTALSRAYMQELMRLRAIRDSAEREALAEFLRESWLERYRALPGYRSRSECLDLLQARNWGALVELGIVQRDPEGAAPWYPAAFSVEQNSVPGETPQKARITPTRVWDDQRGRPWARLAARRA